MDVWDLGVSVVWMAFPAIRSISFRMTELQAAVESLQQRP